MSLEDFYKNTYVSRGEYTKRYAYEKLSAKPEEIQEQPVNVDDTTLPPVKTSRSENYNAQEGLEFYKSINNHLQAIDSLLNSQEELQDREGLILLRAFYKQTQDAIAQGRYDEAADILVDPLDKKEAPKLLGSETLGKGLKYAEGITINVVLPFTIKTAANSAANHLFGNQKKGESDLTTAGREFTRTAITTNGLGALQAFTHDEEYDPLKITLQAGADAALDRVRFHIQKRGGEHLGSVINGTLQPIYQKLDLNEQKFTRDQSIGLQLTNSFSYAMENIITGSRKENIGLGQNIKENTYDFINLSGDVTLEKAGQQLSTTIPKFTSIKITEEPRAILKHALNINDEKIPYQANVYVNTATRIVKQDFDDIGNHIGKGGADFVAAGLKLPFTKDPDKLIEAVGKPANHVRDIVSSTHKRIIGTFTGLYPTVRPIVPGSDISKSTGARVNEYVQGYNRFRPHKFTPGIASNTNTNHNNSLSDPSGNKTPSTENTLGKQGTNNSLTPENIQSTQEHINHETIMRTQNTFSSDVLTKKSTSPQ